MLGTVQGRQGREAVLFGGCKAGPQRPSLSACYHHLVATAELAFCKLHWLPDCLPQRPPRCPLKEDRPSGLSQTHGKSALDPDVPTCPSFLTALPHPSLCPEEDGSPPVTGMRPWRGSCQPPLFFHPPWQPWKFWSGGQRVPGGGGAEHPSLTSAPHILGIRPTWAPSPGPAPVPGPPYPPLSCRPSTGCATGQTRNVCPPPPGSPRRRLSR